MKILTIDFSKYPNYKLTTLDRIRLGVRQDLLLKILGSGISICVTVGVLAILGLMPGWMLFAISPFIVISVITAAECFSNEAFKCATVAEIIPKNLLNKIQTFNAAFKLRSKADQFLHACMSAEEYALEVKSWERQAEVLTTQLNDTLEDFKCKLSVIKNRKSLLAMENNLKALDDGNVASTIDYSRYIAIIRGKEKLNG